MRVGNPNPTGILAPPQITLILAYYAMLSEVFCSDIFFCSLDDCPRYSIDNTTIQRLNTCDVS